MGRQRQIFGVLALLVSLVAGAAWMARGPVSHPNIEMVGPIPVGAGRSVWVQKHEVTVAEYDACHAAGACALKLTAPPDQRPETTPATGLSHPDAAAFIAWLNSATGHEFRLPTVAEWTAVAASVLPDDPDPIFTDPSLRWASAYLTEAGISRALKPSGSFSTTAQGIADLDGSVWEWTADCYSGARTPDPTDRCPAFFVAGVHIAAMSFLVRDPARGGCATGTPPAHLGMRLFSDTAPPA